MEPWLVLWAQTPPSDSSSSFWYWALGLFTSAIIAMWGALMWFVKTQTQYGTQREAKMASAIGEMELFQRTVLLDMVKKNSDAMTTHSHALNQNTSATEDLKKEIHTLRLEHRASREAARSDQRKRRNDGQHTSPSPDDDVR